MSGNFLKQILQYVNKTGLKKHQSYQTYDRITWEERNQCSRITWEERNQCSKTWTNQSRVKILVDPPAAGSGNP